MKDDVYHAFSFVSTQCNQPRDDQVICEACENLAKKFRGRCPERATGTKKDFVPGQRMEFTVSSPSLMSKYKSYNDNMKNRLKCSVYYYKTNYTEIINRTGIEISTEQASLIFNSETEKAYVTVIEKEVDSDD